MSSSIDTYDVIIVGGGFAGMALAAALANYMPDGFRTVIIDRSQPFELGSLEFDGRASALSAASKEMLDLLAVWPLVEDEAQPILDIDITDSSLKATIRPVVLHYQNTLSGDQAKGTKPASWMVENYRLREALLMTVRELDAIEYLAPETVTNMERDDHWVTVEYYRAKAIRHGVSRGARQLYA